MFTIYNLKPAFQQILRPTTKYFYTMGITANQVTVIACSGSIGLGLFLTFKFKHGHYHNYALLLIPLYLFIRMALNAIDGMLAREYKQKSNLGAILNEITDVVSDSALYLPFALIMPNYLVCILVILAIISEMIGVVAIQIGASRRYDGPMGKSDRAFQFGLIALILFFFRQNWFLAKILSVYLIIIILLILLTIFNRGRNALSELKSN